MFQRTQIFKLLISSFSFKWTWIFITVFHFGTGAEIPVSEISKSESMSTSMRNLTFFNDSAAISNLKIHNPDPLGGPIDWKHHCKILWSPAIQCIVVDCGAIFSIGIVALPINLICKNAPFGFNCIMCNTDCRVSHNALSGQCKMEKSGGESAYKCKCNWEEEVTPHFIIDQGCNSYDFCENSLDPMLDEKFVEWFDAFYQTVLRLNLHLTVCTEDGACVHGENGECGCTTDCHYVHGLPVGDCSFEYPENSCFSMDHKMTFCRCYEKYE